MRKHFIVSLLCALPCLAWQEEPAAKPPAVAESLPAGTLLHVEATGLRDLRRHLEGTEILALFDEPEVRAFLEPVWNGMREDLTYLLREQPEFAARLHGPAPGPLTFSVLTAGEETRDIQLVCTVEVGEGAEALYRDLLSLAREDGDEILEREIAGRPAMSDGTVQEDEDEDDIPMTLILDGTRLVLTGGEGVAEAFFGERDQSLAQSERFQAVRAGLGMASPMMLFYADAVGILEAFGATDVFELVDLGIEEDEEESEENKKRREIMRKVTTESPLARSLQAVGFALGVDGSKLKDRLFLYAPGDRSSWSSFGDLGDAPARHAALSTAKADIFASVRIDAQGRLNQDAAEKERIRKLYADADLEPAEGILDDPIDQLFERIQDKVGIDVKKEVLPLLGSVASIYIDIPAGGLAIPDVGLILDLADAEGMDALLARLLEKNDALAEVELTKMSFQGHDMIAASLLHAGLPILPTVSRVDNQLLVTLTPQAMKSNLRNREKGKHLAASERFQGFQSVAPQASGMLAWIDLGAGFQYAYSFLGVGLSALRMQGIEISDRFDPALLPNGQVIAGYLGEGMFFVTETEAGLSYDGRSSLANPLIGFLGGILGVTGMIGASEGLRSAVADERTSQSREHLEKLGLAARTYRGSVGAGSWPGNLVQLLDRGILDDPEILLDPSDPKPRRVRTGTGDRVQLSYAIGTTASLPSVVREKLASESEYFLYTRGAWHERWGSKGRLLLPLAEEATHPTFIPDEQWTK